MDDGCSRIKPKTQGGKDKDGNIKRLDEEKEDILAFYDKVKWSRGDNRRLGDTDWLGYTSILSFFHSLPFLLLSVTRN